MNAAAKAVAADLPEIAIAYGVSDEYRYEQNLYHSIYQPILLIRETQFCSPQVLQLVRTTRQVCPPNIIAI